MQYGIECPGNWAGVFRVHFIQIEWNEVLCFFTRRLERALRLWSERSRRWASRTMTTRAAPSVRRTWASPTRRSRRLAMAQRRRWARCLKACSRSRAATRSDSSASSCSGRRRSGRRTHSSTTTSRASRWHSTSLTSASWRVFLRPTRASGPTCASSSRQTMVCSIYPHFENQLIRVQLKRSCVLLLDSAEIEKQRLEEKQRFARKRQGKNKSMSMWGVFVERYILHIER